MTDIDIVKCTRKDIPSFSEIMCTAFNDKYPKFFSGLHERDYCQLVSQINLSDYDLNGNLGKYIIKYDHEVVGAIDFYTKGKRVPLGPTIKILSSQMNIIKSLKTSVMLLGFGPPFKLPEKTLYIDKIGVLEKYRGKGLGKKLIIHAFNIAIQEDIQFVELEVTAKNQNAISLYEKMGFKITKSTKTTLGRIFVGVSKYYRMRKKLSKTNDKH